MQLLIQSVCALLSASPGSFAFWFGGALTMAFKSSKVLTDSVPKLESSDGGHSEAMQRDLCSSPTSAAEDSHGVIESP